MAAKERLGLVDNLIGQRFGLLTVLEKCDYRGTGGEVYWKCQCDCGNIVEVRGQNLKRKNENRTISCGCAHRSAGEIYISRILDENKIAYLQQYRFPDLPKSSFDFAVIKGDKPIRLIEFDGEQHFEEVPFFATPLTVVQARDQQKNEYALSHDIPLVRIPYWERDNITLDMILGDKYLVR